MCIYTPTIESKKMGFLDFPWRAVGLARLDGLARLLDLLQNGVVVERFFGDDFGSLALEGHVV